MSLFICGPWAKPEQRFAKTISPANLVSHFNTWVLTENKHGCSEGIKYYRKPCQLKAHFSSLLFGENCHIWPCFCRVVQCCGRVCLYFRKKVVQLISSSLALLFRTVEIEILNFSQNDLTRCDHGGSLMSRGDLDNGKLFTTQSGRLRIPIPALLIEPSDALN